MRKFILALAVLLGGVSALVAPAGAATATKPLKQASGPFTGTSTFDFSNPSCSFAHQVFDATYSPKKGGTGSFHLDGCTDLGTNAGFPFSGTATLTTPSGTVLSGTVSGTVGPETGALDFTMSLTGTGTSVTIHLTGTWNSAGQAGVPYPITGTLSSK